MEKTESIKAFSTERFSTLLRSDLTVNKGNYIKIAIAALGVFAALAFLISINAVIDINSLKQVTDLTGRNFENAISTKQTSYGTMYLAISIWLLCIGLTVLGSLTFSNFSSKKQRISALMIPASRIEKFSLRVLLYFVTGTVLLCIGFLLGLGICEIAFGGGRNVIESIFNFFNSSFSGSITTALILMALLGNSLYALGSSIWPKLSWIKTWVVIIVVQWVCALFVMMISATHINWYSFFTFADVHVHFFKWTMLSTLAILNIVCWALAWWRYKNTQIIQRFMTK